jgi:hypothetical protein
VGAHHKTLFLDFRSSYFGYSHGPTSFLVSPEDVFEAFVVCVDIANIAQQVVPPGFQSMNNYGEF